MADHDHDPDRFEPGAGDPDAPWRPGYVGPEPQPVESAQAGAPEAVPPDDLPDRWSREGEALADGASGLAPPDPASSPVDVREESTDRPNRLIVAGVVGLVATVIAAAVVVSSRGSDDDRAIEIPETVEELWSIDTDLNADIHITAGVVVVSEQSGEMRGLDARSGVSLWTIDVSDGRSSGEVFTTVEVLERDGVVVVAARPLSSEDGTARAIDVRDGNELWQRDLPQETNFFMLGDSLFEFTFDLDERGADRPQAVLVDPESGEPATDPFRLVDLGFSPPVVSIVDPAAPDRIALFDVETRRIVATGIDDRGVTAISMLGGRVVAATDDGALVLLGDDGEVVDEIDVNVGDLAHSGLLEQIADIAVGLLIGDESVIAFEIVDDRIEIVWGMPGALAFVSNPGDEPLVAIGGAQPAETWLRVIDARSGDVTLEIDGSSNHRFWFRDAVVAIDGLVYADNSAVRALDVEGAEVWSIDGDVERFLVGDGVIITFERGQLSAYG